MLGVKKVLANISLIWSKYSCFGIILIFIDNYAFSVFISRKTHEFDNLTTMWLN